MVRKSVHLISLGCPKNLVDSEFVLGLLAEQGYQVVEQPEEAGVIVVNTCAFLKPAVEESIETILEMAEFKKEGSAGILAVIGCLPQRFQADLAALLPEVDVIYGTGGLERLPEILAGRDFRPWARPGFCPDAPGPRLHSAPFFRAYLKIAEGCSNRCSYCLIPRLRGPLHSRPMAALLEEAACLAASGVKELILVAQDTTAYGRDLEPKATLSRLLVELAGIPGLSWIRVMYAYPSGIDPELIRVMAQEPKVLPYLDLPLQHVSPDILKRMRRPSSLNLPGLIRRLRENIPGLTLRTTMMVGFPGEGPEDFERLLEFVGQARFERLGVFKFSPEEGVSAASFPAQVPQRTKENRRRKLMALQRRISRELNQRLIGRTIPVLIEGLSSETDLLLVGRTPGQAPEIDGQVYITQGTASSGDIKSVLITKAHDYDLEGVISDGLIT